MQRLLMPRTHTEQNELAPAHILAPLTPEQTRARAPRNSNLDSLLKLDGPRSEPAAEMLELDPTPGIFLGLRVALLFNAGLGIAALLGYEAWAAMTR